MLFSELNTFRRSAKSFIGGNSECSEIVPFPKPSKGTPSHFIAHLVRNVSIDGDRAIPRPMEGNFWIGLFNGFFLELVQDRAHKTVVSVRQSHTHPRPPCYLGVPLGLLQNGRIKGPLQGPL